MPTILLADDSITIQKIVNLTFSGEGIDVVTVGNGEAALKKIHELRPALVLADIFMPGRNGYEVCDYIKNEPALSATPVILLVGAFEPFDSNEAARVKADGHLTKPFEIKVLISAVNSLISAAEEQKEAIEPLPETVVPEAVEPDTPAEPLSESVVHEAVASDATAEPAAGAFAPLPDMPQTSRAEWEPTAELPPPEPVFAEAAMPVALGVAAEDTEMLEPATSGPVAEAFGSAETVVAEHREAKRVEPLLLIEDSDPLGLLAVDGNFGAAPGGEIALDSRSLVVDIWEPRPALEIETPAAESAVVAAEESATESSEPVLPVEEPETQVTATSHVAMAELQDEVPVSQAVATEEAELEPAAPQLIPERVQAPAAVSDAASEELIERIANRVVEKLSREVIEKIAWEVVPDLAELMIKEHVEAQVKESHLR